MLSLISTGTPCRGPRTRPAFLSLSRSDAIESASGFSSITELTAGPCLSISSMRSMYFRVRDWAVLSGRHAGLQLADGRFVELESGRHVWFTRAAFAQYFF